MEVAIQRSHIVKQAKKTADFVYDALCKSIVEGELKPGQRLREVEVAGAFGISRTPIREALRRVEEHHLLTRQVNGAYIIAEWDKKTLWELATLRGNLESLAISMAIKKITDEDYQYLGDLINKMDRIVKHKDYEKLILLDIQFHQYLWACSGHALLQETLSQMTPQIRYFMMLTKFGDEESYPETHQELIDVLKKGDADQAMEAIQKHVLETAERLIEQINVN